MPLPDVSVDDHVVHPKHGVGRVTSLDTQVISGVEMQLCAISFTRYKLTVRVPVVRLSSEGVRPLSDSETVERALLELQTPSKIRRADQYRLITNCQDQIATGALLNAAKVARDLYRAKSVRETPYSIEQTFQTAVDRMVDEIALVQGITADMARRLILDRLVEDRPQD